MIPLFSVSSLSSGPSSTTSLTANDFSFLFTQLYWSFLSRLVHCKSVRPPPHVLTPHPPRGQQFSIQSCLSLPREEEIQPESPKPENSGPAAQDGPSHTCVVKPPQVILICSPLRPLLEAFLCPTAKPGAPQLFRASLSHLQSGESRPPCQPSATYAGC